MAQENIGNKVAQLQQLLHQRAPAIEAEWVNTDGIVLVCHKPSLRTARALSVPAASTFTERGIALDDAKRVFAEDPPALEWVLEARKDNVIKVLLVSGAASRCLNLELEGGEVRVTVVAEPK